MIFFSCVFFIKFYKLSFGSVVEIMYIVVDMFCKRINKVFIKVDGYFYVFIVYVGNMFSI